MSDEKRTFSRVKTRLTAYARVAESLDTPPMTGAAHTFESCSRDALASSGKLPEQLVTFLCEMDKKLDQMLSMMSQDQIRSDYPHTFEILEISGAGAKFRSDAKLKKDQPVDLILILNRFPLRMASTKAKIVGKDSETDLFRLEFVNIIESELESIIQYVFQRQREMIRNAKRAD